eukprot:COSAG02_NODE_43654_length_373_cov_0.521898_1_plen_21_part_10
MLIVAVSVLLHADCRSQCVLL